jgi:hypothetical protein
VKVELEIIGGWIEDSLADKVEIFAIGIKGWRLILKNRLGGEIGLRILYIAELDSRTIFAK